MGVIDDFLARIVAVEKEAIPTADSVPRFFYAGEAFPYFTHRVSNIDYAADNNNENTDIATLDIVIRFVVGHLTQDYAGEIEKMLYSNVSTIKNYIQQRELLQSAAYPTRPDLLISAYITNMGGLRVFENTGIQQQQVGCEFTLQLTYYEEVIQVYN